MHGTVFNPNFNIQEEDLEYTYQKELTIKLDNTSCEFDQNILNEIILWKVNRYAKFRSDVIQLVNSINPTSSKLDIVKTRLILTELLNTKGVQLTMASTILRFRNPNIYQIIDQRVYRIIYPNQVLKINTYKSEKNIEFQINLYIKYLDDLRNVCNNLQIRFDKSDRILYNADIRINKSVKLNNY